MVSLCLMDLGIAENLSGGGASHSYQGIDAEAKTTESRPALEAGNGSVPKRKVLGAG